MATLSRIWKGPGRFGWVTPTLSRCAVPPPRLSRADELYANLGLARSYLSPPASLLARLRALLPALGMRAGAGVFAGDYVSSKVRLEVKPMRSLRQSLLAITALLLSACGTGYDYKPSEVDCNDRVNYFLCHFNGDV